MGNSFPGLFWLGFTAARPGRREAAKLFRVAVDDAKIDVDEAHDPIAGLCLREANGFARQCLADEHEVAAPFDVAAGAHAPDGVVGIVPRLFEFGGIGSGRGCVVRLRRLLAQRLVRALLVVASTEAIEAALLGLWRGGRRARGFRLEGTMHALMATVLLRLTGLDTLQPDAELEPLHGELGEPAGTLAGKGRAVVAADRPGQAMLAKSPHEARAHPLAGRPHDAAGQQIAAMIVADRQRIAAFTIPGAKPTLEVGAPDIVRLRDVEEGPGRRAERPAPPAAHTQTLAAQQIPDRARRRPGPTRILLRQNPTQLARPPIRSAPAQPQDRHRHFLAHPAGRAQRCARAIP